MFSNKRTLITGISGLLVVSWQNICLIMETKFLGCSEGERMDQRQKIWSMREFMTKFM